jgi:hypothetical protein
MKPLIVTAIAAIGIALPATAGAATFSGIVVAKQSARHALVVASRTGVVRTVHTHRLGTRVGARVAVTARRLSDGTFSAQKVAVRGRAHRARVRGVVAHRIRSGYLLSAGHSVLAIHTRHFSDAATTTSGPTPGTVVDVTVNTDDAELDEEDVEELGDEQELELVGKVASITPATATTAGEMVLQVGKSTIDIVIPAGTTLRSGLAPGDMVEVEVELAGDTFTLARAHEEDDDQGEDENDDDDGDHAHG